MMQKTQFPHNKLIYDFLWLNDVGLIQEEWDVWNT